MNTQPTATRDRREAIRRAGSAVVLLHVDPTATSAARRHNNVVNDLELHDDWEAWEAVLVLESMVRVRGLATVLEETAQVVPGQGGRP